MADFDNQDSACIEYALQGTARHSVTAVQIYKPALPTGLVMVWFHVQ